MKRLSALTASIFLLTGAALAEDWPFLRGPNNNGISSAKLDPVDDEPERIWKASGPRGGASVVVADGLVFTAGTGEENVVCYDAATGEKRWSHGNLGEWHGCQTPSYADGRIFMTTIDDVKKPPKARCFDAKTGDEIWMRELPVCDGQRHYGLSGSPLISGDVVIFNAGGGVALKQESGEPIWENEGFPGLATPAHFKAENQDAVAIFQGAQLAALDLKSGEQLWAIPWKTDLAVNAHHPLIFDGKALINSDYGLGRALYDVSGSSPKELWNLPKGSGHAFAASVLHEGLVYGIFENALACLDPADGSLKWKAPGTGSVLLIDGNLVRVTEGGEIQIAPVSPDGFEPILVGQIHGGTLRNNPAYVDGKIYIKNDAGEVVCVRISK